MQPHDFMLGLRQAGIESREVGPFGSHPQIRFSAEDEDGREWEFDAHFPNKDKMLARIQCNAGFTLRGMGLYPTISILKDPEQISHLVETARQDIRDSRARGTRDCMDVAHAIAEEKY